MARSAPRTVFGIHSITPYRPSDGLPYGLLEVLGGGNMELTGEFEDLYGGSSRYAYDSEATNIGAQMTANVKSYDDFLIELFLGGTVERRDPAAGGEIRNVGNLNGTSVIQSATGISGVSIDSTKVADLKFGRYVVVATDTNKVRVHAITNIDFNRGDNASYLNDALAVSEELTIVSTESVAVPKFGIELDAGSGTIGMTEGHTAVFDVMPPHNGFSEIDIGSSTSEFPGFGAFMLAQKKSDGGIFQIEAFNCKGSGMPIPLQEKAWAISDLTVKLLRDPARDKVMKITAFDGIN